MQTPKTFEEVLGIIKQIKFRDRVLHLGEMGNGFYLQVQYLEKCVDTGKMMTQKARKWYISTFASETEIVETAFKAIKVSNEHVLKEHFSYKGRRVFSPHFDIDARIAMCDAGKFDSRS